VAIIESLPLDQIDSPRLKKMMAQAEDLHVPDPQFFQILAHAPGYAEALFDAFYQSYAEGNVSHKLKEIIRIQLARYAKDPYFAGLRSKRAKEEGLTEDDIEAGVEGFERDDRFSPAEKWALDYAYQMYRDPKKLNKSFYDQGKEYYSEAQIMELGAFVALHYGLQVFMQTLQLQPANQS